MVTVDDQEVQNHNMQRHVNDPYFLFKEQPQRSASFLDIRGSKKAQSQESLSDN